QNSGGISKTLQDETSCPICLEYFKDPVVLDCDHNFCRACITQCWEGSQTLSCPQCRQTCPEKNLRPNRQLRNIVEAARGLRLQSAREAETEGLCEKHREPLKLFCKDDQIPICVVCDRSKEHRDHRVIPAEEAAEEFKVRPTLSLFLLLLQRKTQTERQKIVSEFQQLRQFLEEQERLLLAQLEKLEKEMGMFHTDNITTLSEEISHLSELISEVEGKCQKPTNEFLQHRDRTAPKIWAQESSSQRSQCNSMSEFLACERVWSFAESQGFTSGRHCWEVEVGGWQCWGVGVARESVQRKREISYSPEEGIWAVWRWEDQFWALTSPKTLLPQSRVPSRIRVCLDCDWGQVTFFRAGDEAPIFTFLPGSVPGERIRPWLWVWDTNTGLRLCP
uniref:Uncharacterized protein n=1 Tax=Pelusios castaneus TaxID=367368 RepID=A0A8C8RJM1_9SAUR